MGFGRPSLYDPKYIGMLYDYFNREPETEDGKPTEFPTKAGFAIKIGVDRDTLKEWADKHPDFSAAYKAAQQFQERHLVANTLKGNFQQTFAIFTAKNVLGWRDNMDFRHAGHDGGPVQTEVIMIPSNGREPKD